MVVPYSAAYPTINQLIGMTLDATTMSPVVEASAGDAARQGLGHSPQQQHFMHLLQEAERRHRATLQRAIHAETQVQQLRLVFQQWQDQLQKQMQAQQVQKMLDQQAQRQVQRQMQSLYDALLRQQRQQVQVHKKIDEMAAFQQMHQQMHQQHLGQVQLQMCSLDRGQRAERRNRLALQRQVSQSRRWKTRRSCIPPAEAATAAKDVCSQGVCDQGVCDQDDCCPCEFPEECPFNRKCQPFSHLVFGSSSFELQLGRGLGAATGCLLGSSGQGLEVLTRRYTVYASEPSRGIAIFPYAPCAPPMHPAGILEWVEVLLCY